MRGKVKSGLSSRLGRNVKQERHDDEDTSAKGNTSDVEVGSSKEIMDKESYEQKGTKKISRAMKEGKRTGSEDGMGEHFSGVGKNSQPASDSGQPKRANRSRRMKPGMSDSEERDSEEEHSGEVSGEAEETTVIEKRGQKTRQRAAMARKEAGSKANAGAPSSLIRSAKSMVRSAQPKSRKTQRVSRHDKEQETSEGEDPKEETSEAGSSDNAMSDSSENSDRVMHAKSSSRTKFSKRNSDEIDHRLRKKVRRQGRGSGNPGPHDFSKSSLKAQRESDEDFVMEVSGDSSSCSEDDKDITDEESNGVSSDSSSEEDVKRKVFKKQKGPENKKEESPEDEASSDEEVCSVCEFAGAADLMLLCDGENCEEAFHSFCLKFPLQSIPEGDWLCPLCVHDKHAKEVDDKPLKRTAKLRTKIIPALKKFEAIIGFREDPSVTESDNRKQRRRQYLVKWCSLSHRHDTWVPEEWVFFADRTRLASYQRKSSIGDGEEMSDERRPEWVQIDRVIACRDQEGHSIVSPSAQGAVEAQGSSSNMREYLVKWTNIEYNGSTWEVENKDEDMQEAVTKFFERHELAEKKAFVKLTDRLVAPTITEQPKYISGGVLHDYQLQGLKWLLSNYQQRKNVILADEMGLGKTIQAVSLIMALKHEHLSSKPVLVIGPKSTLVGWEQEFRQWGAVLNSVIYQGEKESRTMIRNHEFYIEGKVPLFDALVTSYDLAMLDNGLLQKFDWSCIIVDEGHRVKNMRSKLGVLLKRQTTDFRLLLTGTPVQNTLTELFALLHFLDPSEFPDPERSAQEFAQVDALSGAGSRGQGGVEQQISRLHELLTPRMLRRLKADVMQGMIPGKKYVEVMCALTPLQRHLYGAILKKNFKQLNRGNTTGKKRSLNFILMDLKMVCNHPYLFPGKEPEHGDADELFRLLVTASGKLQLLEKLLPKLKEGGHRVLLFSQMTTMLDILEDFLSHLNFKFCRIDGATVASERQKQIAEFNSLNSHLFIFLISTRAGGLGINLPSADTVIIYDPDFNPFVDLQAQARAHRIGQENVVLVYQLITKCSVEEKIIERSRQKLAMENLVMSSSAKDTAEDVNTLLLHGARKVLEEHDVEATSVKWTNEDLELLLNRDISDTKDAKEGGPGYLGAVQGGVLDGRPVDGSPLKTGREWDDLLGKLAEQDKETEEANLGRGKRQRRNIQYSFEPNIDAHDDDEEAQDADDPSASDASSASLSASESDVSLDDEIGTGLRGSYLKTVRSMNEEQVLSSPLSQHPDQGLHQLPISIPPSLNHLSQPASLGQKIPPKSKILPPSSSSPLYLNLSSPRQPAYGTPHIPSWPTSIYPPTTLTASASSSPSPGASHSHSTTPSSHAWNDMSASPGSFWEYTAPRVHGLSSASASQTYQPLLSPLYGSREPSNPGRTQITGSSVPYHTAVGHKVSERLSPRALKTTSTSISMQQGGSPYDSPKDLKFTPMSRGVQQGKMPPSSFLAQSEADREHLSSSLPYGPAKQSSNSEPGVTRFPIPKSHWSQASPISNVSQDDKGLSLQDFLQQARSSLTTQSHALTTGTPQLFDDAKSTLGDVLQLASATHIRKEDAYQRTGSIVSETQSQFLQDSTNMSLGQAVRPTGSKLTGSKKAVPQQSGATLSGTKQVVSPRTPTLVPSATQMTLSNHPTSPYPKGISSVFTEAEREVQKIIGKPMRPTRQPPSGSS